MNEEIRRQAIGDYEVITCHQADLLEHEIEKTENNTRKSSRQKNTF